LREFVELVPFSMPLVASHGCTLLKLHHHGITVILRRLDFALHALRDVHLFLNDRNGEPERGGVNESR
jgi:hypothetical protein